MEAANAAIATVAKNGVAAADIKHWKGGKSNKKKVNVLKAALLTLFGRSRKTTTCMHAEVVADADNWQAMLVGCMHPTSNHHLLEKDIANLMMLPDAKGNDNEEQVLEKEKQIVVAEEKEEEDVNNKLPGSPCLSECGGDSRYASAMDLQEMDKSGSSDEDDNEDELFDDTQGDAMIDMKAEMFIAQFYAQMRIQNDELAS